MIVPTAPAWGVGDIRFAESALQPSFFSPARLWLALIRSAVGGLATTRAQGTGQVEDPLEDPENPSLY